MPDRASHVVVEDGGKDRRLHAVAVVGTATINGDVAFLARNSWGVSWGDEGHAWLPLTYVDARAVHIIELEAQVT
jgi:C1A family cysteine protease